MTRGFHALNEVRAYQAIYLSLVPTLVWLFIRHGLSPMTIFSVNPPLKWGGTGFDTKYERYQLFGGNAMAIPTVLIDGDVVYDEPGIRAVMARHGLSLPLIAKPNRGHRSLGVRKLTTMGEVLAFVGSPRAGAFLLQPFIDAPHEFAVFYGRIPGEPGRILNVTERVLPPRLVAAGRFDGARFVNRPELITEQLRRVIDDAAIAADFHFGKFDVKVPTPAALARGEGLRILEVNGATAQLTSVFDESFSFWRARRAVFRQAEFLLAVARRLPRRAGAPQVTLREVFRQWGEWKAVSRQ